MHNQPEIWQKNKPFGQNSKPRRRRASLISRRLLRRWTLNTTIRLLNCSRKSGNKLLSSTPYFVVWEAVWLLLERQRMDFAFCERPSQSDALLKTSSVSVNHSPSRPETKEQASKSRKPTH